MKKFFLISLLTLLSPAVFGQQELIDRLKIVTQTESGAVYILNADEMKKLVSWAETQAALTAVQAASISSLNTTITTLSTKNDDLTDQLATVNSNLSTANSQLLVAQQQIVALQAQLANCQSPLPGLVPFTFPPLQYNNGSWPNVGTTTIVGGALIDRLSQTAQAAPRVWRRDFGLDSPTSGGFLREPIGKLRRYAMKITIPLDYKPVEMNNWFQFHPSSSPTGPYLSFFGWTSTTRWRHIRPDTTFVDYNIKPYKLGHTYDCRVEVRWNQNNDGILRVWEDNVQIINFTGPTFRTDETEAPYIIFGQYLPNVAAAFDNTIIFSDFSITDL